MTYTNPPLDKSDVIKTLKARGLQIADETLATAFLEDVSYFHFAAYLRPMEIDAISHTYKTNASFEYLRKEEVGAQLWRASARDT